MIQFDLNKVINVVLIGLGLVYFTQCGGAKVVEVVPDDYISPKEFEYRMEVIDLIQKNTSLEVEIINFKKKYEKDTTIINNSDSRELRELFSKRFNR